MKKYTQEGIAHIFLIIVIVVVVALVGLFIVKNTSFKLTNNGKTVVDTDASSNTTKEIRNTDNTEEDTKIVKDLAKDHFKNIYTQSIDAAYATACNYFKEFTSRDKFETVVTSGFFKAVNLSLVDYTQVDVASSQARLKGKIGPLMPDKMLEVDLLKENNVWCIAGYRTV